MTGPVRVVITLVAVFGFAVVTPAQELDDKAYSKLVKTAISLLEKEHVLRTPVDDAISRRWYGKFFELLDPRRMYFLAEDIEAFRSYEPLLDDQGRAGEFSLAKLVRERYQQRVKEAIEKAHKTLLEAHDFSLDEECPVSYDNFASSQSARDERWRLRIKCELLIEKQIKRPMEETRSQFAGRYDRIFKQAMELNDDWLVTYYIEALTSAVDPHCGYLNDYVLRTYRGGLIRPLSIGLQFSAQSHRNLIERVPDRYQHSAKLVVGHELLAIESLDGRMFDVVEFDTRDWLKFPWGSLISDSKEGEVILHLWNPKSLRRSTVSWPLVRAY